MHSGPTCFNMIGERLSGPKAFELLVDFMTNSTSSGLNLVGSVCFSWWMFLTVFLIVLS